MSIVRWMRDRKRRRLTARLAYTEVMATEHPDRWVKRYAQEESARLRAELAFLASLDGAVPAAKLKGAQ